MLYIKNRVINLKKYFLFTMSFFIPVLLFTIILRMSNVYPFGRISNLVDDLSIQYVELYAYLQNVFQNKARLEYSFTKTLGGGCTALYAYYLSSPLNLLLLLFKKENIQMFVYIASGIKIGLSGIFEMLYLDERFPELKSLEKLLLSMCFSISYYNIHQVQNLMWIDGVYMLPLIMYGVWKCIKDEIRLPLIFSVAASILFNWYTAYMNCLFAILYFIFEFLKKKRNAKEWFSSCFRFGYCMFLGVLLSSILFLPNIYGLLQGKGQRQENIWQWQTNGTVFNILRGFVLGNDFASNELSIFCGTIGLLMASVGLVVLYKKAKREFIVSMFLMIFMILSLLLKPLENIWNGFRFAWSDLYRFSYLQTWLLIYFASFGFQIEMSDIKTVCKIAAFYIGIWYLCDYILAFDSKMLYCTLGAVGLLCLACYCWKATFPVAKMFGAGLLMVVTIAELLINGTKVNASIYTWGTYNTYESYVSGQKALIEDIKSVDKDIFYRIEQTINRGKEASKCSAFFLESMGYNYYGLSHYSSTFNELIKKFIESLGYGENDTVSMYDEPILSSDSLLGIKYVMAETQYPGLVLVSDTEINEKKVYENPYSLPLGFEVSKKSLRSIHSENHFEFQNQMFSNLIGRKVELYKPASVQMVACEGDQIVYEVEATEGTFLYGYADSEFSDLQLIIDDRYRCNYETWLSYKIFNVSDQPGKHVVKFNNFNGSADQIHTYFYQLDLDVFQEVVNILRNNSFHTLEFKDGIVKGTIEMEEDGYVLLTVPMEKGWEVTVNGEKTEVEMGINAFITIPLEKGMNKIIMNYRVPCARVGLIISIVTLVAILITEYLLKHKGIKRYDINHFTGI